MSKHSLALTLHRWGSRVPWSKNHIVDSFACLLGVMCLKAWWGRWGSVGNAVFTCSKLVGMACGNEKRHRLCKNASQDGDTLVRILFKKYGWSWNGLIWRCYKLWCSAVCVCVCVYLFFGWLVAWLKFKWRHGNRYASDCGLNIFHLGCALRARPTKLKSRVSATSDQITNKPSHILQL